MTPDIPRFQSTLAQIDHLLNAGRYHELESLSQGRRLNASQIAAAIEEFPEKLAPRPSYDLNDLSVVHIRGSLPPSWSVYLHLWRQEGGRSDLTAQLTLSDTQAGMYAVEIDNIHVL